MSIVWRRLARPVILCCICIVLHGCGGYTVEHFSYWKPGDFASTRNRNGVFQWQGTSLYVRPVNTYYSEQGFWIFGVKFDHEEFKPGFDPRYYGPDGLSPANFLIEVMINAGNSDIDFDPRSVRIVLGQGEFAANGVAVRETPYKLKPGVVPGEDLKRAWSRGRLCSIHRPPPRYGLVDLSALLVPPTGSSVLRLASGETKCLLLRFPVKAIDPRTTDFTVRVGSITVDSRIVLVPEMEFVRRRETSITQSGP
jgi:hypothetical protein